MSSRDRISVEAANAFYRNAVIVFKSCLARNLMCTVENPLRSWFWSFDEWPQIIAQGNVYAGIFQNCMHGASVTSGANGLSTSDSILSLCATCDGKHEHQPWGASLNSSNKRMLDYATKEESEYPGLLCERVVDLYEAIAVSKGALAPPCDLPAALSLGL